VGWGGVGHNIGNAMIPFLPFTKLLLLKSSNTKLPLILDV